LSADPAMGARARRKHWLVRGATAEALSRATLSGLAEAITGHAQDWKLLDFKGDPKTLRARDRVDITPLLKKAAAEPEKPSSVSTPTSLKVSEEGVEFIKTHEGLRLKPYDDQTGKTITEWKRGATIGYGHVIEQPDWEKFKNGISGEEAERLLASDLKTRGEDAVRRHVTAGLTQQQYDALVALAFNIGGGPEGLAGSTVVKMINDPEYKSSQYKDLESAWKAWRKSGGKVRQGLINRRQDEWQLYSKGDYGRDLR